MIGRAPRVRLAMALLAAIAAGAVSCSGRRIDLTQTLQVTDVTTGWFDAGVVDNKNKLVPSISFRLKNANGAIPGSVQLNAVFRRMGESEELSSAFIRAIGSNGLAAGASTDPIVLRSTFGYTGGEPRAQMLANRLFVDAQVQLFAKYGSAQWAKLGEFKIQRLLLTQ
jgi:hypothetical protein